MPQTIDLSSLSPKQLFSLAIQVERFHFQFFKSWANRLQTFDNNAVQLLNSLGADAKQRYQALKSTSRRLFGGELPEPDPELYASMVRHIDLPGLRYFVTSSEESRNILDIALSLQKNTIELLDHIERVLEPRHHYQLSNLSESAQVNISMVSEHFAIVRNERVVSELDS